MIEYVAEHSQGVPVLYKRLVENEKVLMTAAIMPSNREELKNVSDEVIYSHINNLLEYMKTLSQSLTVTPSGTNPRDGWAIVGWGNLSQVNSLTSQWWEYVEFRDITEDNSGAVAHTH